MLSLMKILLGVLFLLYPVDSARVRFKQFKVGGKQNPGTSCRDIKDHGGTVNGNYYIKLNGQTLKVHCDQTTAGGGWTLVYSYTFTDYAHFGDGTNAVTPRPSWPVSGNVRLSTTPPLSEIDYNAMDFNMWRNLGSEFMMKSNINNWYACKDGTGSFVYWRTGSIKCRLVKNFIGKCGEVVPNTLMINKGNGGPYLLDDRVKTATDNIIWYLNPSNNDGEFPTHDGCGIDFPFVLVTPNPHGNVYIR